jgi:hypothetical protein
VIACVALWRGHAAAPTVVAAAQVSAPAPIAATVVAPAPETAPAVPPQEPAAAPAIVAAPVVAPAPSPAPAAPAIAAAAPTAAAVPAPVVAAPTVPQPSAPALAKVEQPKVEPAKPEPAKAEETKPEVAKTEAPKPEEVRAVAAAGAGTGEARERCQQSIKEKRAKDIVALCSAAFEQDSNNADAAVAVAKVEFDRGRFAQAYNWSKKAIAINPAAADAYVFAGGAEQNQGHGKAAKESYLQYLRLAPGGRYAAELRTIVNSL